MINEKIVKLNETDLEEVCGGADGDKTFTQTFKESMVSEAGKQTLLLIAAPIVISASVGISTFAKWAFERLTKKIDEKLDGKQAKA